MEIELQLHYARTGELHHGRILSCVRHTRGLITKLEFDGYSFSRMMSKLAGFARECDAVGITIHRLEMADTHYRFTEEMLEAFKEDPAAVISSMQQPDRVVVIRDEQRRRASSPPTGLIRAGHDTLAAALGERTYIRQNEDKFECPSCGRWCRIFTPVLFCSLGDCKYTLEKKLAGQSWITVSTEELLAKNFDRYYLPREWNPSRGWITHAELKEMYEQYIKEKNECSQADNKV